MPRITHLNCGWLHKPPMPPACCHCLLVETESTVVLIDAGIGLHDVEDPEGRIGRDAIEFAGFHFHADLTAVRQLKARGIEPDAVEHIVLTHCDSDHVGGLSDFANAQVHVAAEEKQAVDDGNPRYTTNQFAHGPNWQTYHENDCEFLDLPARRIGAIEGIDIRLVPLFGHTAGHCGVAVRDGEQWWLHVGDAYYISNQLDDRPHPVEEFATLAAVDNDQRRESLQKLRSLVASHGGRLTYLGYHDVNELPADLRTLAKPA
ncbi:MAG: MBL fold metallo-hydrolase [Planctomycetota bacterium]